MACPCLQTNLLGISFCKQSFVSYPPDISDKTTKCTVSCAEEESDEEHYVHWNVSSVTIFDVDGKESDLLSCPLSYETLSIKKPRTTPLDENINSMFDSTTSFVSPATSNNKLAQASKDLNKVIYKKIKLISNHRITLM